jgi:predicted nucleic acid-binding protein
MSRFVLDCSVTMTWCFEDETSPWTQSVLAAITAREAVVPGHWPLEVANVLAIAERRQRVTAAQIARFLANLDGLRITVDDQTAKKAFGDILALARTHQLTAYDAAYLELALRSGCPLASLDDALNRAATRLGIALFEG